MMTEFFAAPLRLPLSNTSEASSTSAVAPMETRSRGRLLQVLGMWFGIAAAVGNTIAAGIVRAPGDIAQWLPNSYLFFSVWVLGGLYALVGASSMAELGAAIPRSGGQYNFSRRAIGEYAGFIVGWSDWLSTCGTAAAVAIVIAEYSGNLVPSLAGPLKLKIIAVGVIIGFFLLQWRGVRWGSRTQLVTSAMKAAAFLIVVAACFLFGHHAHAASTPANTAAALPMPSGWPLAVAFILGLQAVIYTVDGWDGVVYFGEEVRHPGRDVPRAIFGSVFSIMGIYLLLNAAVLYILPISEIAGNNFSLGTAATRIFGPLGDPIIRSIMLISLLSCLNANQLFCSRTLYAMSCDGLFFRRVASVNPGGTPVLSFFFVANYTLSYTSLFVLRRREPAMPRPYRAWGYPWTTAIALVGSVVFLAGSIITDQHNAPLALLLLVCSYPVFLVLKWAQRRTGSSHHVANP